MTRVVPGGGPARLSAGRTAKAMAAAEAAEAARRAGPNTRGNTPAGIYLLRLHYIIVIIISSGSSRSSTESLERGIAAMKTQIET